MSRLIGNLIQNLSTSAIQDFFTRKIPTYQPIEENQNHIIEDEERFAQFSDLRKELYRAVCRLVWNRVSKAKSMKGK
ncbi:MAG: hypothetical protein PF489_09580 [Salinivirgaceae bacterium]|jgi:hypothetical protein|nr:hypothetical protein [Salinivirgaceae bacterium]